MVAAQLAKQLLLTPEIRRSNPDIGYNVSKIYLCQLLVNLEKTKIDGKRGQERPIFEKKLGA